MASHASLPPGKRAGHRARVGRAVTAVTRLGSGLPLLVGLDLGTSGVKAVVLEVGRQVRLVAAASAPYPTLQPYPGWAEQDPEQWWQGALEATRQAIDRARQASRSGSVVGLGLSGQMHGLVVVDGRGIPIRPAIIWSDARTGREVDALYELLGREGITQVLRSPLHTGLTAANILWLKRHEPESWRRTRRVATCKDYLRFRLTGEWASEASDASATGLLDVARGKWATGVVDALEINPSVLPPLIDSWASAGKLTRRAARLLKLPEACPVAAGAGDQQAALLGHGLTEPGDGMAAIGSGGQFVVVVDRPYVDRDLRVHTLCHAVPDRWAVMAAILSAGIALEWVVKLLAGPSRAASLTDLTDSLVRAAGEVRPGADGLLFLPYLTGERTPYLDPLARGAWVGLRRYHTAAHLVRAVLEGVAFAMRDGMQVLEQLGIRPRSLIASGTGGSNPVWRQIQADVYRHTLVARHGGHASAAGAAALAGVAVGIWGSVAQAARAVSEALRDDLETEQRTEPGSEAAATYDRLFGLYRMLYALLRHVSGELSGISS